MQLDVVRWEIPVLFGRRPNRLFRSFGQSPILMKLSNGRQGLAAPSRRDALEYDVFVEMGQGRFGAEPARASQAPDQGGIIAVHSASGRNFTRRKYAVLVPLEMIASTPRTAAAAARDGGLGLLEPARSGRHSVSGGSIEPAARASGGPRIEIVTLNRPAQRIGPRLPATRRLRCEALRELYRSYRDENTCEARGLRLLRDWLSPCQREQFDAQGVPNSKRAADRKSARSEFGASLQRLSLSMIGHDSYSAISGSTLIGSRASASA